MLDKLHDIEGLDFISAWPLAIGWWLLMALAIGLLIAISYWIVKRIAFKFSWKHDALQKLSSLEENLSEATACATVILLSEYLRRIALSRFSRKECASLTGDEWLRWLAKNDPKNFNWEKRGAVLVELPYAPQNSSVSIAQVKELIQAARNWI